MSYPKIIKEAALERMFNTDLSLREISDQLGIPRATLHQWKRNYRMFQDDKQSHATTDNPAESWTPEQKFAVVLETATLSEVELNTYCREKGVYPGQIKAWREACVRGNAPQDKQLRREGIYQQQKRKIKSLEREVKRKDKALSETVALLVLRKKYDALWE
ncbi:MAG: transposase, partial [Bacteroides sp.]|nr:transposase [Bacteroides sp.]